MRTLNGYFRPCLPTGKFEKWIVHCTFLFLFKISQYEVLKCIYFEVTGLRNYRLKSEQGSTDLRKTVELSVQSHGRRHALR